MTGRTAAAEGASPPVEQEMEELFYQRTRICLWMGVVFFSFFSLLDFVHCRPWFSVFFFYRLSFVLILLGMLRLLKQPEVKRHTRPMMFAAMLLGALIISLMTVKLGGFASGYYVGILLMVAGGFSVLPLTVLQALLLGGGLSALGRLMQASALERQAPALADALQWLASLGLTTLVLMALYALTPNRHVPRKHALIGATVAALVLTLTQSGFGVYVGLARGNPLVFGAVSAFPILLLWLQLIWLVVLSGAVLTAALPYWADEAWHDASGVSRRWLHVLDTLLCLSAAQERGRALTLGRLRDDVHTGYDELGQILDTLARAGLVSRTRDDGWLLTGRPEHITLRQLHQLFVLPPLPERLRSPTAQALRATLSDGVIALTVDG